MNLYIYICDIDILILDDILKIHLGLMEKYQLIYSNIIRKNTNPKKMSGLHFIKYKDYFPIKIDKLDFSLNDEELLYQIMADKNLLIDEKFRCRPLPGMHLSLNREPIVTLNTHRPSWEIKKYIKEYTYYTNNKQYRFLYHTLDLEMQLLLMIVNFICKNKFNILNLYSLRYMINKKTIHQIDNLENIIAKREEFIQKNELDMALQATCQLLVNDPFSLSSHIRYIWILIRKNNIDFANEYFNTLIDFGYKEQLYQHNTIKKFLISGILKGKL